MTNPQTEARAIARCVRGCATDDQYIELVERIATALAAKDAELSVQVEAKEHARRECDRAEAALAAERAALAEARKALDEADGVIEEMVAAENEWQCNPADDERIASAQSRASVYLAARRAQTGGQDG